MNEADPISKSASDYMEHLAEINAKIEDFDEALALLKQVDAAYRRDAIFDAGKPRLYPCLCGAGRDSDHFPNCQLAAFLKKWSKK